MAMEFRKGLSLPHRQNRESCNTAPLRSDTKEYVERNFGAHSRGSVLALVVVTERCTGGPVGRS